MKTVPGIRIILASLLLAGAASAVPIAGSISIVSFLDPAFSFDLTANTVTFGVGANAIVSNRSGSYALAIPVLIQRHRHLRTMRHPTGAAMTTQIDGPRRRAMHKLRPDSTTEPRRTHRQRRRTFDRLTRRAIRHQ